MPFTNVSLFFFRLKYPKKIQKPKYMGGKTSLKAPQGHIIHVCKISGSNSQKRRGHGHLKEFGVLRFNQPVVRDEVHHSVLCLLDVPRRALLFRLRRGRPRPCSRRLAARGAVFVFLSKYRTCQFVRVESYQSHMCHARKRVVKK